jgi:hypothetical protein
VRESIAEAYFLVAQGLLAAVCVLNLSIVVGVGVAFGEAEADGSVVGTTVSMSATSFLIRSHSSGAKTSSQITTEPTVG